MRDERYPHALPRAPVDGPHEAGLRAVPTPLNADTRRKPEEVRCLNCKKLLLEYLQGTAITVCPRCNKRITATR